MTRDGSTETLALIGFDLSRDGTTVLRASAPCRGRAICSTVSATQWSLRPTWPAPQKNGPDVGVIVIRVACARIGTEVTPPATTLVASRLPGKRTRAFARTLTVTRVGAKPRAGEGDISRLEVHPIPAVASDGGRDNERAELGFLQVSRVREIRLDKGGSKRRGYR